MNLFPLPKQKFFDNNGRPLVGGLVFTYEAGTTNKIVTYDDTGTPNTNPIVLDYRGECDIWGDPTLTYKLVLAPANDTDPPTAPIWTVDNIAVPGGGGGGGSGPGAPNNSIQYNNAGAFAGSSKLLYNNVTGTITFGIVNATATLIGPTGTGTDDGGNVTIAGGDADSGDAGDVRLTAGVSSGGAQGSAFINVNNVDFIEVTSNGEIKLAGDEGASGEVLTSGGTGLPVSWQPGATPVTTFDIDSSGYIYEFANILGTDWTSTLCGDTPTFAPTPDSGNGVHDHPADVAASNDLDALAFRFDTASAAPNNCGGFHEGAPVYQHYMLTSAGAPVSGGFKCMLVFGYRIGIASSRAWGGFAPGGSPDPISGSVDPSAAVNIFGIGKDAADTNMQFMHNDGSGTATKTDLGFTLQSLINKVLILEFSVPRGGASVSYRFRSLTDSTTLASGIVTTNLPAVSTELVWAVSLNSGPDNTTVSTALVRGAMGYPD